MSITALHQAQQPETRGQTERFPVSYATARPVQPIIPLCVPSPFSSSRSQPERRTSPSSNPPASSMARPCTKAGPCACAATASKPPDPPPSIDTAGAKVIDLPGATLLPGLVEGHSHILLHPYNETPWNDQVAHEGLALRVARAVNHLRDTLMAGFTTVRDLGTEGRRLRRCRTQAGGEPGHHSRSAHPRLDARHRGHRQLRAEGFRARMARAAGRRRGRRRRQPDPRGARPDRPRRGLDQALRRLSLGRRSRRAPHVFTRRNEARGRDGQERRRARRRAHHHARRHAPRDPGAAPRPSSTATTARPKSSS